jgi:Ser/Thr protein kinase RdoA (MazF antagonist)
LDRIPVESFYTEAASKALECFEVEAKDISLVALSENITFRVSVRGDDPDYTLRLHRPGYNTLEELQSERVWTGALNEAGIKVPASHVTKRGEHYVLIDIPEAGEQRYAGLTSWLNGMPLNDHLVKTGDRKERLIFFRRIGEIAAAIHNQSAGWKEPPGFVRRKLDIEALLGEEPAWGRFWEHRDLSKAERELLIRARAEAYEVLVDYGSNDENFSLIHADLHPDNIVMSGNDLALIDFDDAAYGWHMYDIASALNDDHFVLGLEDTGRALLEGYLEHRPLPERDRRMLRTFLLVRGMAIIGWFHQRPEHEGSTYLKDVMEGVLEACHRLSTLTEMR